MISNTTNISVRINGIVIRSLKVRRELKNGMYTRRNELVIFDPLLGAFPLDNTEIIEVKDLSVQPPAMREWRRVTVSKLFDLLVEVGAIPSLCKAA